MQKLVEDYITKASRGPRTAALILPTGVSGPIDVPEETPAEELVEDVPALVAALPTPRLRPDSIVTAYAADETGSVTAAAAATAVAAGQAPVDQIATLMPDEFRAQGDIADDQDGLAEDLPPPAPIAAVPADAADRFADMPVMSGWKIQLAAAPTQQAALTILQRARSESAAMFPDAAAYTEPVDKGTETLYRARFAGFDGKEEAQAACAFLVKKKFACYAVAE